MPQTAMLASQEPQDLWEPEVSQERREPVPGRALSQMEPLPRVLGARRASWVVPQEPLGLESQEQEMFPAFARQVQRAQMVLRGSVPPVLPEQPLF